MSTLNLQVFRLQCAYSKCRLDYFRLVKISIKRSPAAEGGLRRPEIFLGRLSGIPRGSMLKATTLIMWTIGFRETVSHRKRFSFYFRLMILKKWRWFVIICRANTNNLRFQVTQGEKSLISTQRNDDFVGFDRIS